MATRNSVAMPPKRMLTQPSRRVACPVRVGMESVSMHGHPAGMAMPPKRMLTQRHGVSMPPGALRSDAGKKKRRPVGRRDFQRRVAGQETRHPF